MSAKINDINLERGDGIVIHFGHSAEQSFFVKVDKQGVCTMEGPLNVNGRTFRITIAGVQEVSPEDMILQLQEVAKLRGWDVETAWAKVNAVAKTLATPLGEGLVFTLETARTEAQR